MFATRRYTDEVGAVDAGLISASFSASTQVSSGACLDLSKFRKYVFQMAARGVQYGNKSILIYSCSTSASSISSASSNWGVVDSANCVVTMLSASASVSSNTAIALLEVRAERLFSGVNPIRYIRPVFTCTSGVSSNSTDVVAISCAGLIPGYGTASSLLTSGLGAPGYTVETDYI